MTRKESARGTHPEHIAKGPADYKLLDTERLVVQPLEVASPAEMVQYFLRNQEHFCETSPTPPSDFYTENYWTKKIKDAHAAFRKDSAYHFVFAFKDNPPNVIGTITLSQIARGPFQAGYLGYGIDRLWVSSDV